MSSGTRSLNASVNHSGGFSLHPFHFFNAHTFTSSLMSIHKSSFVEKIMLFVASSSFSRKYDIAFCRPDCLE